jgi:putative transposase
MARRDRREPIVKNDDDRRTFVRTLGETCERAGFRIHAWVLIIARTVAS